MARSQKSDDQYSDEEAKERLVAALRGARLAGHKPMESLLKKKRTKKAKKSRKTTNKPG
jgi:hypothetical protein